MDDHYIHNSHEVETIQMTINPRGKCKGILICSLKIKKQLETGANAPGQIWPLNSLDPWGAQAAGVPGWLTDSVDPEESFTAPPRADVQT